MNKFPISYVSNLPLEGNSPKVTNNSEEDCIVQIADLDKNEVVYYEKLPKGETFIGKRQWYTTWIIDILDENKNEIEWDFYNAYNEVVFIKMDAYALGDNIAWIPYVEEFRKKHKCKVICSTFWNFLFEDVYPDIMFVKPNTEIKNVYAQYYIGALEKENYKFCPIMPKDNPLQKIASETLGLEHKEVVPKIYYPKSLKNRYDKKYVCISEFASAESKMWKDVGGWQAVVNFLKSKGLEVIVISKEKTNLKNVIDKSGDIDLDDRIHDLLFCEFFMGVSSGLAWLAWGLNKHVVMISDFSPPYHEFQSNITRIGGKKLGAINYDYSQITSKKDVINQLEIII